MDEVHRVGLSRKNKETLFWRRSLPGTGLSAVGEGSSQAGITRTYGQIVVSGHVLEI